MTSSAKKAAINLINNFEPYSGPLFETDEGFEVILQQSETYIQDVPRDVLVEANRLINLTHRLNKNRRFPQNTDYTAILEGAILDAIN